jgi:hypothetical protein
MNQLYSTYRQCHSNPLTKQQMSNLDLNSLQLLQYQFITSQKDAYFHFGSTDTAAKPILGECQILLLQEIEQARSQATYLKWVSAHQSSQAELPDQAASAQLVATLLLRHRGQ